MEGKTEEQAILDPVFLSVGQEVYTYEHIETLREKNVQLKGEGKEIWDLIPQKGFQENVLTIDADMLIIGGKRGGGKALSVNEKVLTPFGFRRIGDLKPGDIITDPSTGGMQKVIYVYDQGIQDLYRVNFIDGTSSVCTLDHLWKVRMTSRQKKRSKLYGGGIDAQWEIWTFEMIKNFFDKKKQGVNRQQNLITPLSSEIKFTKSGRNMKRPDIDPYIIGVLLGDGCITGSKSNISFVTADKEIADRIAQQFELGHPYNKGGACNYNILGNEIVDILKSLKLYGCTSLTKHIPTKYKYASIEERYSLLSGLMDTDATVSTDGKISFCSVSKQLAEDVAFVIRSLGGKATITSSPSGYKNQSGEFIECKTSYDVYINIPTQNKLFTLERKLKRLTPYNNGVSEVGRRITGYEYVGKGEARCIRVSGANGLFCTNDFVVTHNSWVSMFYALLYIDNPQASMYAFRKYEDDILRTIWKTSLQVFSGFGEAKSSFMEWEFPGGAKMKMEHLQDLRKIKDRFRGAEMCYIDIEELPEHTITDMDVVFTLLGSNRNTIGVKSRFIATCNPVGKSNALRLFLDWYIDPDTDKVIPERSGRIRYFYRYGEKSLKEIAWGNTKSEVYANPNAREKIDDICKATGKKPFDLITSLCFVEGEYSDNKILDAADPNYMNRISSQGGDSSTKDIVGIWRDTDNGQSLITVEDIESVFENAEQRTGYMRASADVALTGDFFVIMAFDGKHICDIEAWRGMATDAVVPFITNFLSRNGVREENFTYDSNGLGLWLKDHFKRAKEFNNKSAASNPKLWNNLKSECAERFANALKQTEWSIDSRLLARTFRDRNGREFTLKERLIAERRAIKRKETDNGRFEIISKQQMRQEIGHSPDFIEAWFMVHHLLANTTQFHRKGFGVWCG